jgi:hypothetical protein
MKGKDEIVLYQPDNAIRLEVRLENETVWLNRQQISELFDRDIKTIGKHINNALREELAGFPTVAKFATVQFIHRLAGKISTGHSVQAMGYPYAKRLFAKRLCYQSEDRTGRKTSGNIFFGNGQAFNGNRKENRLLCQNVLASGGRYFL